VAHSSTRICATQALTALFLGSCTGEDTHSTPSLRLVAQDRLRAPIFNQKLSSAPKCGLTHRALIVLGIEHDTAPHAFAIALGDEIMFVPQSQVEYTALA
jgi:hypothetical protein